MDLGKKFLTAVFSEIIYSVTLSIMAFFPPWGILLIACRLADGTSGIVIPANQVLPGSHTSFSDKKGTMVSLVVRCKFKS